MLTKFSCTRCCRWSFQKCSSRTIKCFLPTRWSWPRKQSVAGAEWRLWNKMPREKKGNLVWHTACICWCSCKDRGGQAQLLQRGPSTAHSHFSIHTLAAQQIKFLVYICVYDIFNSISVKLGQRKKEGKQGLTSEDILYIRCKLQLLRYWGT